MCRLSLKHNKKEKSAENTTCNKAPNVEYDYVEDTGSTYQELGHVHHNYNNTE